MSIETVKERETIRPYQSIRHLQSPGDNAWGASQAVYQKGIAVGRCWAGRRDGCFGLAAAQHRSGGADVELELQQLTVSWLLVPYVSCTALSSLAQLFPPQLR